jgi:hypothetical protein
MNKDVEHYLLAFFVLYFSYIMLLLLTFVLFTSSFSNSRICYVSNCLLFILLSCPCFVLSYTLIFLHTIFINDNKFNNNNFIMKFILCARLRTPDFLKKLFICLFCFHVLGFLFFIVLCGGTLWHL